MAHAPRKKSLEELKAEAIAELERRGLNVRGKTPAQIRKLLRLRFKKRNSNQTEETRRGGPIIETRHQTLTDRGFYFADLVLSLSLKQQSRRRYAANGFALSPIAPLSWAAVVGLSN